MQKYLEATEIVDYNNKEVHALAMSLSKDCQTDTQIAKNCFEYVRDEIEHSGDCRAEITTLKSSDVLKHKTGWCYSKSILLAGLLRANGIPTGFAYQRLSCSEYKKDLYCLHGLNAIYLKEFGWYRVDARGNKEGVNAQFNPPHEQLAFKLGEGEFDLAEILSEPLEEVVLALKKNKDYDEMVKNFPDIKEENHKEEMCQCIDSPSMVMMSRYNENPLVCFYCNDFISPESINIDVETTAKLQEWRVVYESIDRLWLESGGYELWATKELNNPQSSLHKQGFEVQKLMQKYDKCYYWWFQDITKEKPLSHCPKCGEVLESRGDRRVCEACLLVLS